jgi:FlaA1/EpsC-like NDP-sugar epimerase
VETGVSASEDRLFEGKCILITGGTGSLGKVLLRRLIRGTNGTPAKIILLSRDEAKQHAIRVEYQSRKWATDEIIYRNFQQLIEFRIGDVRDYHSLASALRGSDIVFNAAALKQVPTCEYFPHEAVRTNVEGPNNIVRAIADLDLKVETVVGVSTDKAAKPVNVMGMTKAIQERIFGSANLYAPQTRFVMTRYGNVLASRGSAIPLFHHQIRSGGPLTITHPAMTRFLLSLDEAVDLIIAAVRTGRRGETYIPRVPAAKMTDVAKALIGDRSVKIAYTGVRPGEKLHEILISEEECPRVSSRGDNYIIAPLLPELRENEIGPPLLTEEYSSEREIAPFEEVEKMLARRKLLIDQTDFQQEQDELLR